MKIKLGQALEYEQPTKYIVASEKYKDEYETPVLTAGKSFILGYTNETDGIYTNLPVIIFDDFTTDVKFVDFPFKVKSSAMKMLQPSSEEYNLKFFYYLIKFMNFQPTSHQRHWISKFAEFEFDIPTKEKQDEIVEKLDKLCEMLALKEKELKKYDDLVKSQFIEMFSGKYSTDSLKNVCEELFAGGDVKKDKYSKIKTNEFNIPIYTNGEKDDGLYGYTDKARVYKESITISGRGTIGFTCLRETPYYPAVRLLVAIPNKNVITATYLKFFIESKNYSGNGVSIPQLTIPMIRDEQIPIPPLELQNQFADFVKHIDKLKFRKNITKLRNICYNIFDFEKFNMQREVKNG